MLDLDAAVMDLSASDEVALLLWVSLGLLVHEALVNAASCSSPLHSPAPNVVEFDFENLELSALGSGLSCLPRSPGRIPSRRFQAGGIVLLELSWRATLPCSPDVVPSVKSP